MKTFTEEEFTRYNGDHGCPVYVGYKGKVYDVTASFLWKDGTHQVLHSAGVDLTVAIEAAPHGEAVLRRFPVVGVLQATGTSDTLSKP